MIMSYKSIFSNTINRQQTGGIIMTELSRFQKDVEVAATALEMRAENEDAKEEAIHLYRKFGSTKQEPLRLAVALRGYFLEEGVEEEERAHYGAYLKKRIRPAVERLIVIVCEGQCSFEHCPQPFLRFFIKIGLIYGLAVYICKTVVKQYSFFRQDML